MSASKAVGAAALLAGVTLGGCGLVSSDVTSVTLDLPSKTYTLDTASSGYQGPPGTIPNVACGDGQLVTDCCNPFPGVAIDCTATPLVCESGSCTYHTTIEYVSTVDLGKDAPQYKQYSGSSLVGLSLKSVNYTAVNALNVASPEITIYLAPANETHSTDPHAEVFGTVAPVPAGSTVTSSVKQAAGASAAFGKYAQDWATPFNFIAAAPITVKGGDTIPMGKITVTVTGQAKIQPGL